MKRVILDAPFDGDILIPMEKGETILWEGQPNNQLKIFGRSSYSHAKYSKKNSARFNIAFWIIMSISTFLLLFFALLFQELLKKMETVFTYLVIVGVISIILFSFRDYLMYKKRNKIKYIITSKKLIFQLLLNKKHNVHILPLDEIEHIQEGIIELSGRRENIFLTIKNPPENIGNYEYIYDKENDKIVLEGLKDVLEIIRILKKAIAKNKSI